MAHDAIGSIRVDEKTKEKHVNTDTAAFMLHPINYDVGEKSKKARENNGHAFKWLWVNKIERAEDSYIFNLFSFNSLSMFFVWIDKFEQNSIAIF